MVAYEFRIAGLEQIVYTRGSFFLYVDPIKFDFEQVKGLRYFATGELFDRTGSDPHNVMVLHVSYRQFVEFFFRHEIPTS